MIIREADVHDARTMANLHASIFPGFFLSSLGEDFLVTYYKSALQYQDTICYFAENNGEICGYVLGRAKAKGYLKKVVLSAPLRIIWQGIKLIFTRPKALIRLVNNLEKKSDDLLFVDNQDYAEIGLIGVLPQYKSQGIGRALFNHFLDELNKRGVKRVSLTTDALNNDSTLRAYKSWGFTILYEFISFPDRRMYRMIKKIDSLLQTKNLDS